MAKARGRGYRNDERRYPNFEGVGPTADMGDTTPGARAGNVGVGAFEQPNTQAGQSRLHGLLNAREQVLGHHAASTPAPMALGGGTLGTSGGPIGTGGVRPTQIKSGTIIKRPPKGRSSTRG